MSARTRAYLYLTIVAAIWGAAAIVIKYTLVYLPPFTFLSYRFIISLLIVAPFLYSHLRKHRYSLSSLREISLLNFVGIPLNLALVFIGINYTTALEAALILSIGPILTVLGGVWFLKEKIHKYEAIGLGFAILGTLIVILEPLFSGHSLAFEGLKGNFILFLSNISLAYYTLRSRVDLHHKYSPWLITMMGFFIAPFIILPFTITEQPLTQFPQLIAQIPLSAHLGVWFMAILSGILAYFLYQIALKTVNASETTIFHYLSTVFTIPLAVFWLHESITLPIVVGAVCITVGVIVSEYHPHRRRHRHLFRWLGQFTPQERLLFTFHASSLALLLSTYVSRSRMASYLGGYYYNSTLHLLLMVISVSLLTYFLHRKLRRLPLTSPHYISGYTLSFLCVLLNILSLL